jgi:hypothetical protein
MKRLYTLYNKKLNKKLIHPRVGLWYTADFEDAKATLKACYEYLDAIGVKDHDDFVIMDAETEEIMDT